MQVNEPIVVERALFRSVNHALNFAYHMEHVSVFPSMNLTQRARFNAWTDLSQLDRHAQAAYIRDIVDRVLTKPERSAIVARHAHGLTKLDGVKGVAKQVNGLTKNSGECLIMVVAGIYLDGYSKRKLARDYSITERSVEDDRLLIKGHIDALEKRAYSDIEREFRKYQGLIDL